MLYVLLFAIGACIGSFVNVIAYRLPLGISFINGRSKCPFCVKEIAPYDLIPLFSFIFLRRRCRNCKATISWQYLLVEILSGLIFAVSFLFFWPAVSIFYWLCFIFIVECLLSLAIVDSQYMILPDSLLVAILIGWLTVSILSSGFNPVEFAQLSLASVGWSATVFLIPFLIWRFSDGKWIGLGDAKLAGVLSLVFGITNTIYILYLAVILGSLVGLGIMVLDRGDGKTKLPLGTFICFSTIFFMFSGFDSAANAVQFIRYLIASFGVV